MKLFRCAGETCGAEFEAAAPECPTCKGAVVVELTPVHYLVADASGSIKTQIGNRRIACMPTRARLPQAATGERVAVTCSRCKAAPVFAAHEEAGVDQHTGALEAKIKAEHGVSVQQTL